MASPGTSGISHASPPEARQAALDAAAARIAQLVAAHSADPATDIQAQIDAANAEWMRIHTIDREATWREAHPAASVPAVTLDTSANEILRIVPPDDVTSAYMWLPINHRDGMVFDRSVNFAGFHRAGLGGELDQYLPSNVDLSHLAVYTDHTIRDWRTGAVVLDLTTLAPAVGLPSPRRDHPGGSRKVNGTVFGAPWTLPPASGYRRGQAVPNRGNMPISTVPKPQSGAQPAMITTYFDPATGGQQTVTGDGAVISSGAPRGYFDIHTAPQPSGNPQTVESAGMRAPVVYVTPHVDVVRGAGVPATSSSPGTVGGTAVDSYVGTTVYGPPATMIDGTPMNQAAAGLPKWAVIAGVAVVIWLAVR